MQLQMNCQYSRGCRNAAAASCSTCGRMNCGKHYVAKSSDTYTSTMHTIKCTDCIEKEWDSIKQLALGGLGFIVVITIISVIAYLLGYRA